MKRTKKISVITAYVCFTLQILNCAAQQTNLAWAKAMGGTVGESGESIAIDTAGNVYTAGYFNGTCDFNPNAGTYNLTSAGSTDLYISKFDASGNLVWANRIGGTGADRASSIALDGNGNIYISGYFQNTADFNPGAGTANLTSIGSYDIFFARYDNNGNYLWAYNIGSTTVDLSENLTVDNAGNVYITGYYTGTADFDPGAGTANLSSWGGNEIFFAKYNSSGTYIWAQSIGSINNDQGFDIGVDGSGNVYISGLLNGTADFNPGAGTANLTPVGAADIFFAKYNSSGAYVWAKNIGSSSSEAAECMTVDAAGNVYISGYFFGTTDFDPGASVAGLSSIGGSDIFFAKYNSTGIYQWAKSIGSINNDHGLGIALDAGNNVYVTGYFQGQANFDPLGTADLTPVGGLDIFYAKYDASGGYLWANSVGDIIGDDGNDIVVDGSGNVYVTGDFKATPDFDPAAGTFNITSTGSSDIFVLKISQCNVSVTITQTNISCSGGNDGIATAIVSGGTSPFTYDWSNSQTTQSSINLAAGTYSVTVTDVNGCTGTATLTITEPSLPLTNTVSFTNASCNNNDGTAGINVTGGVPPYSYLWSNSSATQTISGLGAGTYFITVTDDNGCSFVDSVILNNSVAPSAPAICLITVDSAVSDHNIIYWDKSGIASSIDSFRIYREVTTGLFSHIASVHRDSLSEYHDYGANPNVTSYKYKLGVLDTCGGGSLLSPFHNSIHLQVLGGGNLQWTLYEIESASNPVTFYRVLRDDLGTGNFIPISSTIPGGNTTYTDLSYAAYPLADYRVDVTWSISCEPTRATVNTTRSNIKHNSMSTGINSAISEESISVYPNPANSIISIEMSNQPNDVTIKIMNVIGQIIEETIVQSSSTKILNKIDVSTYSKGIYTVSFESNGTRMYKKIAVN